MKNKIAYICIVFLTLFLVLGTYFAFFAPLKSMCPSDFPETDEGDEARMKALDNWTNEFYDMYPNATIIDWAHARHQYWVDNNCAKELEGYEVIKTSE